MKNKKGLDAPSNMVVLMIFIIFLAIIIILALYFGQNIKGSESFQTITNFSRSLTW